MLSLYADVDECQTDNGGCAQICDNIDGSFLCSCDPGYILGTDNFNCEGIIISFLMILRKWCH